MYTPETLLRETLRLIDERLEAQNVVLLSCARKSSDPSVQAAIKTIDNLTTLKESIIEAWKGQRDAGA